MGIDLKLLMSNFRERPDRVLSTAQIRLDRDPRILSLFSKQSDPCIVEDMPEGMKVGHFEDGGLRYDEKDRYGNTLSYTTSDKVKLSTEKLRDHIDDISRWNRAALAFLVSLPPVTKIFLYWC